MALRWCFATTVAYVGVQIAIANHFHRWFYSFLSWFVWSVNGGKWWTKNWLMFPNAPRLCFQMPCFCHGGTSTTVLSFMQENVVRELWGIFPTKMAQTKVVADQFNSEYFCPYIGLHIHVQFLSTYISSYLHWSLYFYGHSSRPTLQYTSFISQGTFLNEGWHCHHTNTFSPTVVLHPLLSSVTDLWDITSFDCSSHETNPLLLSGVLHYCCGSKGLFSPSVCGEYLLKYCV